MNNQHKLIKGYRDLTESEISAMNEVKELGSQLETMVIKMQANKELDQRWVEAGKMQLQQGIMALVRSIAKPESF